MKITVVSKQEKKSVEPTESSFTIEILTQTGVQIRGDVRQQQVIKEEFERLKLGQVLFEG